MGQILPWRSESLTSGLMLDQSLQEGDRYSAIEAHVVVSGRNNQCVSPHLLSS